LRNSQLEAIKADPNSAMATSIDIGDRYDIHPTQKQILGARLAKAISAVAYNSDTPRIGPYPESATVENGNILVKFNGLKGGLKSYSTPNPPSVEACQGDRCEYALSTIEGEKLKIKIPENMMPDKIRYAWAESPIVTLFSGDDLPIPTFELTINK
jgi:sialate O-acetylesterase